MENTMKISSQNHKVRASIAFTKVVSAGAFLALLLLTSSQVFSAVIPGLFNTGVDNSGQELSPGSSDTHYNLAGPLSAAYVIQKYPGWAHAPAGSLWIGPLSGLTTAPVGDYSYKLPFDLTGFDPDTASITGNWATDNIAEILLNGNSTGIVNNFSGTSSETFITLHDFTINSGFVPGENTLEFVVTNLPSSINSLNPTGLLVTNLSSQVSAVPLPASVWFLGSGLFFLMTFAYKSYSLALRTVTI
jgi:hypothetical protein